MKIKKKEDEYDNQGYPIYLWNWELKAEFGAIIVMQDWPKGIFFQSLADFSNTDSHLFKWVKQFHQLLISPIHTKQTKLSNS